MPCEEYAKAELEKVRDWMDAKERKRRKQREEGRRGLLAPC